MIHELSHIICKHQPIKIGTLPGLPFPVREYDAGQEEEAIWLGACLQLPRAGLLWARRQGMGDEEIAEYYGASIQ
jgi:hypothetical protein